MKRSTFRGFGIACILSGCLMIGWDYFFPAESTSDEMVKYEEKITQLESQLKEKEQQLKEMENQTSTNDSKEEGTTTQSAAEETASPNEQGDVTEGILYIYSGLTPYEISKKLKDMGIIQNAVEMELFLAQPEYARSIQKGQYKVNSSMSVEEIANLITGKRNS